MLSAYQEQTINAEVTLRNIFEVALDTVQDTSSDEAMRIIIAEHDRRCALYERFSWIRQEFAHECSGNDDVAEPEVEDNEQTDPVVQMVQVPDDDEDPQ